ncbi:MAG: hypothetical protein PHS49_08400 [Candidatus Gracilibacteria bacterium]|nr:hypothetical protein [Candidatus Gracilibacteria bacterium]
MIINKNMGLEDNLQGFSPEFPDTNESKIGYDFSEDSEGDLDIDFELLSGGKNPNRNIEHTTSEYSGKLSKILD